MRCVPAEHHTTSGTNGIRLDSATPASYSMLMPMVVLVTATPPSSPKPALQCYDVTENYITQSHAKTEPRRVGQLLRHNYHFP
jgi:hypothetical protein